MPTTPVNNPTLFFCQEGHPRLPSNPPTKASKFQRIKSQSKEVKEKIIAFSKVSLLLIAGFFQKLHSTQIPLKLKYIEFGFEMTKCIGHKVTAIKKISNKLLKTIQNTSQVVLDFFKSKPMHNALCVINLSTFAAVPCALYDIGFNLAICIKGSVSEKFDAFMQMFADCGIIGECVATFAIGLQKLGAVPIQAIQWTTPLFAASLAFSAATVILHAKESVESAWVLRQLCKKVRKVPCELKTVEAYRPLYNYLRTKNNKFVQRHFKVDPVQFQNRLKEVWEIAKHTQANSKAAPTDKEKALKRLTRMVNNLKMQKIARIALSCFLVVSCIFSIVAGFIILFTPAGPVAYGLMIGGVVIACLAAISGTYYTHRFKNQMGIASKGGVCLFCEKKIRWFKQHSRSLFPRLLSLTSRKKRTPLLPKKYSFLASVP